MKTMSALTAKEKKVTGGTGTFLSVDNEAKRYLSPFFPRDKGRSRRFFNYPNGSSSERSPPGPAAFRKPVKLFATPVV
jgi:hypothetical protein